MLIGNFYQIIESSQEGSLIQARVKLNPKHPIFEGHFPENPVVPGVCQIQMVEEVLNAVTGKKNVLKKSGYIKFLHLVNPLTNDEVQMELRLSQPEDQLMPVSASYQWCDKTVFKFKGYFQ